MKKGNFVYYVGRQTEVDRELSEAYEFEWPESNTLYTVGEVGDDGFVRLAELNLPAFVWFKPSEFRKAMRGHNRTNFLANLGIKRLEKCDRAEIDRRFTTKEKF